MKLIRRTGELIFENPIAKTYGAMLREALDSGTKAMQHVYIDRKLVVSVDFSGQNMYNSDWTGSAIEFCNFTSTELQKNIFNQTNFRHCNFTGARFNDAKLTGAHFQECNFTNTMMHDAFIKHARFTDCSVRYASLHNGSGRVLKFDDVRLNRICNDIVTVLHKSDGQKTAEMCSMAKI